jgi:hypothetical protein
LHESYHRRLQERFDEVGDEEEVELKTTPTKKPYMEAIRKAGDRLLSTSHRSSFLHDSGSSSGDGEKQLGTRAQ